MTYNMKNQNAPKHPLPRQCNPATQRMLHTGQVTSVREHTSINIPCTHVPQNSFLKSAVASVRRLQSLLGERGKESSEGESGQVQQLEVAPSSPSPLASPSNHASIDGMDSVYANALRRSASYCLLLSNSGPFHQSVLIRSSRGGTLVPLHVVPEVVLRSTPGDACQRARYRCRWNMQWLVCPFSFSNKTQ